jgi:hypothetical protein
MPISVLLSELQKRTLRTVRQTEGKVSEHEFDICACRA